MVGEAGLNQIMRVQHGIVTWAQCRSVGLSRSFVLKRLQARSWQRIHRGIYKCTSTPLSQGEREVAALFAAGEGAALSHFSAASLWELPLRSRREVFISLPNTRRIAALKGVDISFVSRLSRLDLRVQKGLSVTSVTRTVFDLAPRIATRDLRVIVEAALRRPECPRNWLMQLEASASGRPGAESLRTVLSLYGIIDGVGKSALESLAVEIAMFMPTTPLRNKTAVVEGKVLGEVDFAWPEVRLVMETDGFDFHADRAAFVRDRIKNNRLQDHGWLVYRFTYAQAQNEPDLCRDQLLQAYRRQQLIPAPPTSNVTFI